MLSYIATTHTQSCSQPVDAVNPCSSPATSSDFLRLIIKSMIIASLPSNQFQLNLLLLNLQHPSPATSSSSKEYLRIIEIKLQRPIIKVSYDECERLLDCISNGKLAEDKKNAMVKRQSVVAESHASQLPFGEMG